MRGFEKVLLFVIIVGVIFWLLHWPFASLLLMTGFSALSMYYFYGGFYAFGKLGKDRSALGFSIVSGLALSVAAVAMLFYILVWPSATSLGAIGIVVCGIGLVSAFVIGRSGLKKDYFKKMKIRYILALSLLGFFTWFGSENWIRILHSDDPIEAGLIIKRNNDNSYENQLELYDYQKEKWESEHDEPFELTAPIEPRP